jgi:hypothetical protein
MEILHWLAIFFVMQNMMGLFMTKLTSTFRPPPPRPSSSAADDAAVVPGGLPIDQFMFPEAIQGATAKGKPLGVTPSNFAEKRTKPHKPACLWQPGTVMDLDVLITDSPNAPSSWPPLTTPAPGDDAPNYDGVGYGGGSVLAEWHERDLIFGGIPPDGSDGGKSSSSISPFFSQFGSSNADQTMNRRNATLVVPIMRSTWNNETGIYAHVRLRRRRASGAVSPTDVLVKRMSLTRYRKRKRNRDVKSLLDSPRDADGGGDSDRGAHDDSVLTLASLNRTHDQVLLYVKPSLTLQIVDFGNIDFPNRASIPLQFADHMDWYDGDPMRDWYYPILYRSEFWITSASLREVNGTMKETRLDVNFEPVAVSLERFNRYYPCYARGAPHLQPVPKLVWGGLLYREPHWNSVFSHLANSTHTRRARRCGSGSCKARPKKAGGSRRR